MEEMDTLEVMRQDLIFAGFRRDFINVLNAYALTTLYDLWDVEDPDEQMINVEEFLKEYGFKKREAFA